MANLDHIEYDLHLHYIDKKYNFRWFCTAFCVTYTLYKLTNDI